MQSVIEIIWYNFTDQETEAKKRSKLLDATQEVGMARVQVGPSHRTKSGVWTGEMAAHHNSTAVPTIWVSLPTFSTCVNSLNLHTGS